MVSKIQGGSAVLVQLAAQSAAPAERQKNREENQTFTSSISVNYHPPKSLQLHLLPYSRLSSQ